MTRIILTGIVLGYRLIPRVIRRLWKMHGSTSHLALAGLREGRTEAFRAAIGVWKGEGGGPHP